MPIYYTRCKNCGFCYAPHMHSWSKDEFTARIYNEGYLQVDPDYVGVRSRDNAAYLVKLIGAEATGISHLDYGGGNGLLSNLLCQSGWHSTSYDPFVDRDVNIANLPPVDLITSFEVFEHVPDLSKLMGDLSALLKNDGIVLFSTLLSDGNIAERSRLNWWYASPRNGHISLYSRDSLYHLAARSGFLISAALRRTCTSYGVQCRLGRHIFFRCSYCRDLRRNHSLIGENIASCSGAGSCLNASAHNSNASGFSAMRTL